MKNILSVRNLNVFFFQNEKKLHAVRGVDLDFNAGRVLCLVGESGSGKSAAALALMNLLPTNSKISYDSLEYLGQPIFPHQQEIFGKIRGREVAYIFQEPMISLNPVLTIQEQIREVLNNNPATDKKQIVQKIESLLESVGISDPLTRMKNYPHEISGGMLQRVMIAMALASQPKLLIADEPTTALDVTIQAQILHLLRSLPNKQSTALLIITHDLGVVAEMATDVAVMYAGCIVESGDAASLFQKPMHPYTRALFSSFPKNHHSKEPLLAIPGSVPSLSQLPSGCAFHPRCPNAQPNCSQVQPQMKKIRDQFVACLYPLD